MGKVIDLRGKLGMAGHPVVETDFGTLTVNDGAANILTIMGIVQGQGIGRGEVERAFRALFEEEDAYDRASAALTVDGLTQLLEQVMDAIMGGDGEGEAETPATT